jgi:hypothetical protein
LTFFLCHAHLFLVSITPSLFHKDCDGNKQSTTHASSATMSTHGINGKGARFCTITFIYVCVWQGLCKMINKGMQKFLDPITCTCTSRLGFKFIKKEIIFQFENEVKIQKLHDYE